MTTRITNEVLANKLDNLTQLIETHIRSDDKHFNEIGDFINGNGTLGAKTRLDRLEQVEAHRRFHIKALWSAITTTAVGLVLTFAANWVWG